ncbi:MAG: restriction endonuclease subunit S [Paludibacteraceae bacterium]|nr:restriction endonuclease subunit S [Paludibacteraceae bacterium]
MANYPTYKLGEICETTSGGTPNRKNDAYYGGTIPWVKSGELGKGIIYDTEEKITEQAVKESSAKIFPKGTLLIALYGATIGKLGFLGVPAATNQAVCGIFANEKIDLQFLSYYLFHKRNDLIAQGTGGAQPNISQTILKNLPIPLPPLTTQHAIVTRIETLFAELDKGVEHLCTAQQQLKTYRQAVLNHWLNNEDGKWEMVKLGEVAEKIQIGPFGTQLHKSDYINGGIPLINPMHISNNKIQPDKSFSVSEEKYKELSNYYLQKDDVILGRRGEMGRCAVVSEKEDGMLCGTGSLYIRGGSAFCADYLCKLLCSQKIIMYFENASSGTTMSNLNRGIIENCEIPLPPLAEQQRIVKEIESRLSQATASETCIENALQQAEALRQSILKKAFSGELI